MVVTLVAGLMAAMGLAPLAYAATVYELEGQWQDGTPTTVETGDAVTAQWWFNLNDDAAAPGNAPVDDVTITVVAANAAFEELPAVCLTDGVTPASSISDDGATMVCNVGTQDEGSALTLNTAMRVTAATGEGIGASATVADQAAELPLLIVENDFLQDIRWEQSAGNSSVVNNDSRDVKFNWTLFHGANSPAGPDTVSYQLTLSNSHDATMQLGPQQCSAFTSGSANGHPWSGGDHADDQLAPFVATCTLTRNSSTSYTLTLSGIDYSHAQAPVRDSMNALLPTDRIAVASGQVQIRVMTTENAGQVSLTSSAPTYTAVDGAEFADDPANNTSTTTWTTGYWNHAWVPSLSGSSAGSWSDDFRASPGTEVTSNVSVTLPNVDVVATQGGLCTVLDTRYVDFTGAVVRDTTANVDLNLPLAYYTGTAASVNPSSPSYDPNTFDCGIATGWTTQLPADLTTVKAVRSIFNISATDGDERVALRTTQTIHDDVDEGQDIWTWGAYNQLNSAGFAWTHSNRSSDVADAPVSGTATPGTRYAYAAGGRDIVRISGIAPTVTKSVSPTTVDPGGSADYTLTYSADGTGSIAESVDGYELVDTLPLGATYQAGSAMPEPATTTDFAGRQVLTWTLDGVTTNEVHELSYAVDYDDDLAGGDRLVNTVQAGVNGVESTTAQASVTVNDAGLTQVIKTADQAFIPNLAGDGVGEGSWTVQVISLDPLPQDFTDTIDVLPYLGDGRGTTMEDGGSFELSGPIDAPDGATVYYTTAAPGTISDDPADATNGAAGDPAGATVGWSTTFTAGATAVRVITGPLAPFARHQFVVPILTDGLVGEDTLVNRAQGRAENTRLVMRTSAPTQIANYYSASLKKYVQDTDGEWRDANDPLDYPTFRVGDTVPYRIVIENTGQGTLTGLEVTDDQQPELGSFTVDELAPGGTETHEFSIVLTDPVADSIVNTACATADIPADSQVEPTINCDPAGIVVLGTPTHEKSLVSATPIGDGEWEVVYDLTVSNTQTPSTSYSLTDELHFTEQATIVSAEVTSAPTGVVPAEPAWDGQGNLLVAADVPLAGNDDDGYQPHVYRLTVVAEVPLQLAGAGSGDADPTQCAADGDATDRAFTNTSTLTDPDGTTEDDWACAELPSIDITKTVSGGPTPNGDGTWTVSYDVVATNDGAAAGDYDVSDRYTPSEHLVVDSAAVVAGPEGVALNEAWTGAGDEGAAENVIAAAATLPAGGSHTYAVEIVLSLDTAEGTPPVPACDSGPGAGTGGLVNTARIVHNDLADDDDACVTVASIDVAKTISDGPNPNGDGTWTIVYDVVAENIGGAAGDYTVTDRLQYGEGVDIESAGVITVPDGVTALETWTGQGDAGADENVVALDVTLAPGGTHTYQVEVVVAMDETTIDPAQLQCPAPGSGGNGGLANSTSLDHNGIVVGDDVCASLPLPQIEKSISAGPTGNGDGTWTITYDLTARNDGDAAGDYDVADQLRYGEGIVIESAAVVTTPDGVTALETWTGQGEDGADENVIARDVTIEAGQTQTYQVEVVVSLDLETVTPGALECPAPGSGESGGLANATELSHNGETRGDEVCAPLPLIDITKSISGAVTPVEDEAGVYDVTYDITVTNRGAGEGSYDLDDELAPGAGIEVVGIQDVTTDVVESVDLNSAFDGLADTTIVTGQPIAGADGDAATEHTYTVVVRYAAQLSDIELPDAPECTTAGGTVDGALNNVAQVSWNGIEEIDDECVRPGKPTLDKALVSADPVGDGQWTVVYDLTVGNVGGEATSYDLDDEFLFASVVAVDSIVVTGPEGVVVNPGFDGAEETRLATDVSIIGLDDDGYVPHVYRVEVLVDVPLSFDQDAVDADGTGAPACTQPTGSNTLEQGLNNAATLTDETGGQVTDTDCAALPSIDITKSMVGSPEQGSDGSWTITYEIDVSNDGAAAGGYDLADRLRYGAGIDVQQATVVTAPEGVVTDAGWTGQGEQGTTANVIVAGVELGASGQHTFRVQVAATIDASDTDATTYACPAAGSGAPGGFANTAGVGHNGLSDSDDACASAPVPPAPQPGLPVTGADVATAGLLVLLLLGAGGGLLAHRRRVTV